MSKTFNTILSLVIISFLSLFIFTHYNINFWAYLAIINIILCILIYTFDKSMLLHVKILPLKEIAIKILLGLLSALALYIIFYIGNIISPYIIPGAEENILNVYNFRYGHSAAVISLIVLLITGPGEEVIWRGFVQRHFQEKYGVISCLMASAVYAFVHLPSLNIMLILASFVCGLFWGLLYFWKRSLLVNAVSHAVWVLAIFVFFPVN